MTKQREGSLEAPTRYPLDWEDPKFFDEEDLKKELRRVFDICHGCRRCFNLCKSFPNLFDLIDEGKTGEVDGVDYKDYQKVVDACTLCDMCFMTKCPYVPPHEFNIDFPHLMLRYKAIQYKKKQVHFAKDQLSKVDRNNPILNTVAPLTNAINQASSPLRPLLEKVMGVDKNASIPKFAGKTLLKRVKDVPLTPNPNGPAFGQKVVIYATCYGNYNEPQIGMLARHILLTQGVDVEVLYPGCCGMPRLELGDIPKVAKSGEQISKTLMPWIDKGYTIVPLVPSCTLMLKMEWPLIYPENEDILKLASHTKDISEYIVDLSKRFGLTPGIKELEEDVTLHLACHARAQNIGAKAAEMLRLIPNLKVKVVERCSGHGGTWGMMKDNFEIALQVGKPVISQIEKEKNKFFASECPLAAEHIRQGLKENAQNYIKAHPIEIFAAAYGLHKF